MYIPVLSGLRRIQDTSNTVYQKYYDFRISPVEHLDLHALSTAQRVWNKEREGHKNKLGL